MDFWAPSKGRFVLLCRQKCPLRTSFQAEGGPALRLAPLLDHPELLHALLPQHLSRDSQREAWEQVPGQRQGLLSLPQRLSWGLQMTPLGFHWQSLWEGD